MKNFFWSILCGFILISCARVGSPVGGDKDTIPPVFLGSNIDSPRINVSTNLKELRLNFNEYVMLKDVQKNLIISPPIKNMTRIIPSNLANKYVLLQWEDKLEENTTYNFNFGNAIVDNNEQVPLPYFNFAFSTGDKLDENYVSGEVTSAFLKPNAKQPTVVVGLYKKTDSLDYKSKPFYVTRADADGYFELNYLAKGEYKLIAFDDVNGNTIYDAGIEDLAFLKEDLTISDNVSGKKLRLFPTAKVPKYKEMKPMVGGIDMIFEGNPKSVYVDTKNPKFNNFKLTHRAYSDTAKIWLDVKNLDIKSNENVRFNYQTEVKKDSASLFYKPETKSDMTLAMMDNKVAPFQPFKINSNYYIDKIDPSNWVLKADSLTTVSFTAEISKTNPFQVLVKADFEEGKKYQLTVAKQSISSFYQTVKNPYRFDFASDKIENYSNLEVNLLNKPEGKFWLQLLDTNFNVVYSQYTDAAKVKFSFIKPQYYLVRMLVDNNGNERWDAADLEKSQEAEDLYTYYKVLNPRPLWDLVEEWDIADPRSLEIPKNIPKTSAPANSGRNDEVIRTDNAAVERLK